MVETHFYSCGERKKEQCLKLHGRDNERQKITLAVIRYHN